MGFAGAAPPAMTTLRARRVAGKRSSSGARKVNWPIAARSSGAHGVCIRAGQASAEDAQWTASYIDFLLQVEAGQASPRRPAFPKDAAPQ